MSKTPALTLALDAATYTGTVAVLRDGAVVADRAVAMRGEHEERLLPAVAAALAEAGATPADIARVVCGGGPGSFTSLRIAASIAKGIASARGVPMFEVPSLALIVAGNALPAGRYLAVLDAMRGETYVAGYARDANGVTEIAAPALVARAAVAVMAEALGARLAGPAEALAFAPHARGVSLLASRLAAAPPVDLATWEPQYGRVAEAQAKWEREHGRPLTGS
jgi:tRNA threonylcarbamoyladenosine biosynthesis protein TsaB